jgi:hypothetical protein
MSLLLLAFLAVVVVTLPADAQTAETIAPAREFPFPSVTLPLTMDDCAGSCPIEILNSKKINKGSLMCKTLENLNGQ